MTSIQYIAKKLVSTHSATKEEIVRIYKEAEDDVVNDICKNACKLRDEVYGKKVFLRGLIEVSSYCKNDCLYCGLRCSNKNADRYRLSKDEIISCAKHGYELGLRTFVLQGGEDDRFSGEYLCDIVRSIKKECTGAAVTLSLGEMNYDQYEKLFEAGADRYLLRHESANTKHYGMLHPSNMHLESRMKCLENLKEIGFQTGAGFMVGSPYQTYENIADDLVFLKEFKPHMVGIGPFIPSKNTPFEDFKSGSIRDVVLSLAITRIYLPKVLLPSTTALSTISQDGRVKGFMASGNVVMPNLSPQDVRDKYMLYNNKANRKGEAVEGIALLKQQTEKIGLSLSFERGDYNNGV